MVNAFELAEPELGPDGLRIETRRALVEAAREVNKRRATFHISSVEVGEWPSHPDLLVATQWLSRQKASEDELEVIYWLARCARSEWAELPKRTASEHRALYSRIQSLCADLGAAIAETGSFYYRGGGHGLMSPSVSQLLTDSERAAFDRALPGGFEEWEGEWAFPRFNELLERIESASKRLSDAGPMHSQPNKRGAERGYFVRRMHELLVQRYGEAPHEVLAALATVALGDATDRELVAKLLK